MGKNFSRDDRFCYATCWEVFRHAFMRTSEGKNQKLSGGHFRQIVDSFGPSYLIKIWTRICHTLNLNARVFAFVSCPMVYFFGRMLGQKCFLS